MDYIQVGKIINTHGIKGEVTIYPLTDDRYRFNDLQIVYLGHDRRRVIVEGARYHKNMVLLKFEEFDNIDDVLPYKGEYLYIDSQDRVILPEDRFFLFDIIGAIVYTVEGKRVGMVSQVIQSTGNDVYVVRNDEMDQEYMIPAVKEFIISIDIDNRRIVIDPIEGMIG
ncbi:MAG: 16S rRNA processing protein RimM [Tissierellia bacterium]|nr:16S rRNA processing protein RimM [Tissierellia bacterium]